MAKRDFGVRSPHAVNLGGTLQDALHFHARERARRLFLYLFDMKVLVTHLNKPPYNLALAFDDGVEVVATAQIDTGFRSNNLGPGGHRLFDDASAMTIDTPVSDFARTDAAHFCNLGIKPAFVAKISRYITAAHRTTDSIPADFYETLKRICGDTELLPQRVNIGPDRVIDKLHGELAGPMLTGGTKIVSDANIVEYKTKAIDAMTAYRERASRDGDHGIAACADCYLAVYGDALVAPPRTLDQKRADARNNVVLKVRATPFVDGLHRSLAGTIHAECAAYVDGSGQPRLNPGDYLL